MKLFQYSTTSSLKKNPQPKIILIFLSLLIPAEVYSCFLFVFLKANTKYIQDQMYAEAWILPLTYTEHTQHVVYRFVWVNGTAYGG